MKQNSDFKLSRTGRGYAFETQEGLCSWAENNPGSYSLSVKPTPEAKIVAAYKLIVAQNKKVKHG